MVRFTATTMRLSSSWSMTCTSRVMGLHTVMFVGWRRPARILGAVAADTACRPRSAPA
jgi:hypothetical protein